MTANNARLDSPTLFFGRPRLEMDAKMLHETFYQSLPFVPARWTFRACFLCSCFSC